MSASLHIRLKELNENGTLELKRDPSRHRKGEGAYFHQNHPIQVLSDVVAPTNPTLLDILTNHGIVFQVPHDLAWCPATKTLLGFAPTDHTISDRKTLLEPPQLEAEA